MALSAAVKQELESRLELTINHVYPVSGGDINQAYRLNTSSGDFFIKVNSATAFPQMFKREQEGLQTLAAADAIGIPKVIVQAEIEAESYLLLEWLEPGELTPKSSKLLGEQLAGLHRATQDQFGFGSNNYMGSLVQKNARCDNFPEFFITQRLQPMVELAVRNKRLLSADARNFERLYIKLPSLTPIEPPALVHGDLWSGNYLIDANGNPYLIDPAVAYSHREVDIALSTLFGGFSREFYEAYQSASPMESGWHARLPLWSLYPLLVHVNLFGGGYAGQVRSVLAKFVGW